MTTPRKRGRTENRRRSNLPCSVECPRCKARQAHARQGNNAKVGRRGVCATCGYAFRLVWLDKAERWVTE